MLHTVAIPVISLLLSAHGFAAGIQASSRESTCDEVFPEAPAAPAPPVGWILCRLIENARLDDLEWSDFQDYREQVNQLYSPQGYALAWISGARPTSQARAMIAFFQHADFKGLDPRDYDATRWESRLKELATAEGRSLDEKLAHFDLALTLSALRYISDLHNGRVSPASFQFGLEAKSFDAAEFLRSRLLGATDSGAILEEIEPRFASYRRTAQAFEHYLALANEGEGTPIPIPTFPLKAGDTYVGVPQLAERLQRLGDLAPDAVLPKRPDLYGGALAVAVKHFQQRHGLNPDGRLTQETYDELITPFAHRAAQLQFTLERFRWLPAKVDSSLIVVNIPEFRLRAYEDHRMALTMRAIVGEAFEHQTPIFADQMEALVFRPYWNVPESITKGELVAELKKHPRYLATHDMQVVDGRGNVITADRVDAKTLKRLEAGTLMLRQQPGPANALGLVKFVFPNQYGIYMHGTPEAGLFGRARRDLSHGCIRVENPAALAAWVLRDDPTWTLERVNAVMHGEESITVRLPHAVPILIVYGTAVVEENNEVHFFRDIYGFDAALRTALGKRNSAVQ